jgi:hypothetical protein
MENTKLLYLRHLACTTEQLPNRSFGKASSPRLTVIRTGVCHFYNFGKLYKNEEGKFGEFGALPL